MSILLECLSLFYTFFRVGLFGFGGGYAMMSMVMTEGQRYGLSATQMADLNALDMIVPGPIAINAATYVGYLVQGFWGSLAATLGVMLPSFLLVTLLVYVVKKSAQGSAANAFLSGAKPAAVGLIGAAACTIILGVLFVPGVSFASFLADPLGSFSLILGGIFLVTAVANIRFRVNPILLTVLAGVAGAMLLR